MKSIVVNEGTLSALKETSESFIGINRQKFTDALSRIKVSPFINNPETMTEELL